jgi:DNA-binding CsgD family transcriptional regulator
MALTRNDETDLLLPLYAGLQENPRFATFLERLRRRTGALYASLFLRHGDAPIDTAIDFSAGTDLRVRAHERGLAADLALDRARYEALRPGRVYSLGEFVDHDPAYRAYRDRTFGLLGIVDERVVRVLDADGVNAWLVIAGTKPCTAADSALLSSLVPFVAAVLRGLLAEERASLAAAIAARGLARAGTGWLLLGADARLVAIDPATAEALADRRGHRPQPGERLRDLPLATERALAEAAQRAGGGALVLRDEPRIEAVFSSAAGLAAATLPGASLLALVRLPTTPSPDRATSLAHLFDLPRREAELALALSDGLPLAAAGASLGLTLETTRNYSKRLYARLGLHGQADLVRLVLRSAAVLA